jgi:hypothetical protein
MMKKEARILIPLIAIVFYANGFSEPTKTMPLKNYPFPDPSKFSFDNSAAPAVNNLATDSPGMVIGTTWWDMQTTGSTGNRIAICEDGSKYFCWGNLLGWPSPPASTYAYHNWINPAGLLNPNGFSGRVSHSQTAMLTTIDIVYNNRCAIAYHVADDTPAVFNLISVDRYPPGFGVFTHYDPPDELYPQTPANPGRLAYPYIGVDRQNRIHLVGTEIVPDTGHFMRMGYARSSDGGANWTTVQLVDTVMVISSVLAASPVSDRVVLAYAKPHDTTTQWRNDIVYFVSEDGITWDWDNGKINITEYGLEGDSLWAYTDLDVLIDLNDCIHIAWNAQWVTDNDVYWRTFLFHYDEEAEEISRIHAYPDDSFPDICGAWNRPVCKMNLGYQGLGYDNLCIVWTQFSPYDISHNGYGNGDLFMAYSYAYYDSWESPVNLTQSGSSFCQPWQCDNDNWASVYNIVSESLHVFYVNDKDAGSAAFGEGQGTQNQMMYLTYPLYHVIPFGAYLICHAYELESNEPIAGALVELMRGFRAILADTTNSNGSILLGTVDAGYYDVRVSKYGYATQRMDDLYLNDINYNRINVYLPYSTSIEYDESKPSRIHLSQNYPNPFNTSTTIEFSLDKPGRTTLEVFDITGKRVATLIDDDMPVGFHSIRWDTAELASGVYFYKLDSSDNSLINKALLIK